MDQRELLVIIEDDPEIQEVYREFLSKQYSILIFDSGEAAIAGIEKVDNVCLIIIDYKLPDITGIEVLRAVKKIKPSVPVLFVTGYGNETIAVNAFRSGAKDYIKKPFTVCELTKKVSFLSNLKSIGQAKEKRSALIDESHQITNKSLFQMDISCKSEHILKALQFIDASYKEKIDLRRVASIAGLSKYHFSRLFKEATGISYQDYVLRLRVERAKEILKSGKYTVTEAAFSAGFLDLTHFGRCFKKIVGLTPIQFKKSRTQFFQVSFRDENIGLIY